MALDPHLTASFERDALNFMNNNLVAVRGIAIEETVLAEGARRLRPRFPALPTSPAPVEPDNKDRAEKNYAITDPLVLSAGIERDARYDGATKGRTTRQLNTLRIYPRQDEAGTFPIYYLPYSDNLSYTMKLNSGPNCPRLFCTEAINGCTFQVAGTPAQPVVSHANVQGTTLSLDTKAQFLEFFLDPPRVGAERIANSILPARLQRFSPSTTATVDPDSVVQYGGAATAAFDAAVHRTIGCAGGTQRMRHQGVAYDVNTILTELNGKPLDPTGGEVAVVGANPNGNLWVFFWSMYLPAKVSTLYYRITPAAGGRPASRQLVDAIVKYEFIPIISGRFLWPDWNAGTPYSIRNGHLGR